jgi:hypothetical protein
MKKRTSINIVLDEKEAQALAAVAETELRHPRDQARYLLRLGLGLAAPAAQPVVVKCEHDDRRAALAGLGAS